MSSDNRSCLDLIDSICNSAEELQRDMQENLKILEAAMSDPEAGTDSFFVKFVSANPPFELREDGIYLGKHKVVDRVMPIR